MILALHTGDLQVRRAIRYAAVLAPVVAASVTIGIFAGPFAGIAAFTALAGVFLPKPGRFFQAVEEDEGPPDEGGPSDEATEEK